MQYYGINSTGTNPQRGMSGNGIGAVTLTITTTTPSAASVYGVQPIPRR